MAWIDDIVELNPADTQGEWNGDTGGGSSGFDAPTLNDSTSTTPIYIESTSCLWWPLKKDITNGYTYTDIIPATPSMENRIVVGLINYPFADIDAIPINNIYLRVSSDTGFTTNYAQWDARAQILSPENVPISGHTPVIGYPDAATETGTPDYTSLESVGWVATTGGTNDGKQGGFDWFFIIGWVGAHSATLSGTYFSGMYDEYFDNEGQGLPGETNRPIGVLSQAGDFFQSNVRFQLGDGTNDTANIDVTETGKTVFFNNLHINHELGFIFVNPASTNEIRLTLTDCTFLWNDQASTSEIFDGIANVDRFQLTGCNFTNGGRISLPSGDTNRYVRGSKFTGCGIGTASDSEFSNCTLDNCGQMTITGDADFTGTQILNSAAAVGTGALVWNDNTDPNGNLDDMVFSKGTNAHHAIEFGTNTPTTITLTGIDFQGFNASDGQNDSTLYFPDTGANVTWTVNLSGGVTGNVSYRKARAGDTVTINNTVTVTLTGMPDNTEVRVYDAATSDPQTELAGIENATAGTAGDRSFAFSLGAGTVVDVVIHNISYEHERFELTIPASDSSIPINLRFDRNYFNP